MAVYKCFKTDFPTVEKKINRITKKLDKHGLKWSFSVIGESIEEVEVIDYRNIDNVPSWQFTPKKLGKKAVEVTSYTFEMESLKIGNFKAIAVLDHTISENENIIYNLTEKTDSIVSIPEKYRTVKSNCEHCNIDRKRNKTVLLQDENSNIKQIGTSCIFEYTGIEASDILNGYTDINDICLTELYVDYEKLESYSKYYETLEYLTACIQLIDEKGYIKESNGIIIATKEESKRLIDCGIKIDTAKYEPIAQTVIDYFANHTFDNDFLNNTKVLLNNKYLNDKTKGFVAFSYISYQKEIEKESKTKAENEHKKLSGYVGNVGDKIEKELTLKKRIAYSACYNGYSESTSYIYLFEDNNGNVYKWNTANFLEKQVGRFLEPINDGENVKLKGSIKAYEEYKDEKQTVLTRCKLI